MNNVYTERGVIPGIFVGSSPAKEKRAPRFEHESFELEDKLDHDYLVDTLNPISRKGKRFIEDSGDEEEDKYDILLLHTSSHQSIITH